jgi:DNA polymerase III epsilon subunit-like protein
MQEGKTRRTLEYVIGALEIPIEGQFHRAIEDAEYTARVFQRIDREKYESFFSVDYYRIPRNRFEEATFYFETYSKYVSRKFNLKEEAVKNRRVREMPCFYCRRQMKKEINWFSDGGHSYFALATCKNHGLMKGRIRIKTTENYDGVFAVRTIKPCSEEDHASIVKKKENLTAKRRERRKKESGKKKEAAEAEVKQQAVDKKQKPQSQAKTKKSGENAKQDS